jgi:hypothetical protein
VGKAGSIHRQPRTGIGSCGLIHERTAPRCDDLTLRTNQFTDLVAALAKVQLQLDVSGCADYPSAALPDAVKRIESHGVGRDQLREIERQLPRAFARAQQLGYLRLAETASKPNDTPLAVVAHSDPALHNGRR